MSVYLQDKEKTWDRVVQGGLKSQRLIEGVSEGSSKWREVEVAYGAQNSPSGFPNPLHSLFRIKKILSVLSLVRKHPTIDPPPQKEGSMNSNMGDKSAFLSCVLMYTHTHNSNWLAFLPNTANAMYSHHQRSSKWNPQKYGPISL